MHFAAVPGMDAMFMISLMAGVYEVTMSVRCELISLLE